MGTRVTWGLWLRGDPGGSYMKWMLHHSIQNVLEVAGNGCCNVASRGSWKMLDTDVTT
jgi:hypothetical protein